MLEKKNKKNTVNLHGFRKRRWIDTALTILTEEIANRKGSKHMVDIVMRDIEKAFDKVWTLGFQYKILNLRRSKIRE